MFPSDRKRAVERGNCRSPLNSMNAEDELLRLVTPGKILTEEFFGPLGISGYRVAKEIGVPPRRINEIVHG